MPTGNKGQKPIIGLGGAIGSGKSVVRRAFGVLGGWRTVDCDAEAKALYFDPSVRDRIINRLGVDPVAVNGTLDKPALRRLLGDISSKQTLESIVHEALFRRLRSLRDEMPEGEVLLAESAILFTSGLSDLCFKTVAVLAPDSLRKGRVLDRDREKGEPFFEEMDKRQEQERKLLLEADFRVLNYDPHSVLLQVEKITKQIDRICP